MPRCLYNLDYFQCLSWHRSTSIRRFVVTRNLLGSHYIRPRQLDHLLCVPTLSLHIDGHRRDIASPVGPSHLPLPMIRAVNFEIWSKLDHMQYYPLMAWLW